MSELRNIEQALAKVVRRQRWQQGWRGFWLGLASGAFIWLAMVAVYKLAPISITALYGCGLAALCLAPLGFLLAAMPSPTLLNAARMVDRKENLQERLSTALESRQLKTGEEWRNLLIADAARHIHSIDARRLLPLSLPKASLWALLALAAGAGLGFAPEYRSKAFVQKQREIEVVKEAGRQLADFTRRSMTQTPPTLPEIRQSMENASNLADQMTKAKLSRNDALKDIASLTDKLKKEADRIPDAQALKRMEQAARSPQGKEATGTPAQKQMETLSKALQDKIDKAEAMEDLKKELEKAKEAATGTASKDSQGDSKAKQELAKSLASMAEKAHDMGIAMPDLDKAIEALASDKTDLMVKDLDAAMKDLEKMKDMAQKFEQLQQQMERAGKDLAEQLDKGQAKAAQETLAKMIKQLETADIPKDQLNKILDEVTKAVKPAGDYGKVADHLKNATAKMHKGEKNEAAKSLDEAAKELAKLMEEMGDMEALQGMLAALDKASMCMEGNGNCFGNKKSGKTGRPGGKSGSGGFGTWAPEEGWMDYPEMADLWENSADNRGNMDSRSNTDRGDGQLADSLDPTKLRGKISPGSSMPSITIKGLSIKGTSKATVESSAVAAQDDSQNALSQEQIPRAYEGAVKDYFDDIKK